LLGIEPVPVLRECKYHDVMMKQLWTTMNPEKNEGYVVRVVNAFTLEEFKMSVAKFVRKSHVQTDIHWSAQKIIPNQIINK
jgi:hypothetical protein